MATDNFKLQERLAGATGKATESTEERGKIERHAVPDTDGVIVIRET
jgi:hypothetical protein